MPTLQFSIKPDEAAAIASIRVDGTAVAGKRLDLAKAKRVRVSVIAVGFRRYSKQIDVDSDTTLEIEMAKLQSKKTRTLAVTLGMGAVGVLAWLVRRR
jgi:hypothetical protein